jgi:hypothetical protein
MDNQEQQAQTVAPNVGGDAPQAQQPELNIADLQNIRAIIDTAARRGTFSAQEMSSVGGVFDRLNAFITAVSPPQAPAEQPQETVGA